MPARIWDCAIGGYQVIKKWLTHRVRRIAARVLLEPALDANYRAVVAAMCAWAGGRVGEPFKG